MKNDIEREFMQGTIAQHATSTNPLTQLPYSDRQWTRALAAGALVAGAAMLLTGRKRGAMVAVGMGAAAVLIENPNAVKELWRRTPQFISEGHTLLTRLEDVVDNLTEQSQRVQSLLRRRA